ncbi:MAG: serine/threonine protein kinase, partial [Pirellula sp.]
MSNALIESSEPSPSEILRLQKQCDLARQEHRIESVDAQDKSLCTHWIEAFVCESNTRRFTNIECLGLGAYGLVFAVDDLRLENKRVAIKVLRPSKSTQRIPAERFDFEGDILVELKHPNIIQEFEVGKIDGMAYHIVEWAESGSLATLLSSNPNRFSPRQAAWLISKIAEALDEAHSMAILHRDLKPGNILLKAYDPKESEGLGLWPLLTDFGLSKKINQSSTEPLTDYGEVLGTLSYMSPEQVQGLSMRPPSDLFSLGIILHELVYGVHPFVDRSHFKTLTNIVQDSPRKPNHLEHKVPSALDAIITKCLQKDSRHRYPRASDLVEDLQRFLRGENISIAKPTAWDSLIELVKDHPKLSVFLGTTIVSLLGTVFLLSREWKTQRDIAEGKAKISELFFQSIKESNSDLNDAIVSGKRVLPSELLENLERQLPLLQEAHQLAPENLDLVHHLQIMNHYISLCYLHEFASKSGEMQQQMKRRAIQAREKSLQYIAFLKTQQSYKEKMEIPWINGLSQMSSLFEHDDDPSLPGLTWNSKAISAAESYLTKNPDEFLVLDTLINTKFVRMVNLRGANRNLEEQIVLCKSVVESSIDAYKRHPERFEFLAHHVRALAKLGNLLLESGDVDESVRADETLESLKKNPDYPQMNDLRILDRLIAFYPERCRTLLKSGNHERVIATTRRWEEFVLAPEHQDYFDAQNAFYQSKDLAVFNLRYYRWIALDRT